jgi:hypothetical protein
MSRKSTVLLLTGVFVGFLLSCYLFDKRYMPKHVLVDDAVLHMDGRNFKIKELK